MEASVHARLTAREGSWDPPAHGAGVTRSGAPPERGPDAGTGLPWPTQVPADWEARWAETEGDRRVEDIGRRAKRAAPDSARSADAPDPALRTGVLPAHLRLRPQLRHPPRAAGRS